MAASSDRATFYRSPPVPLTTIVMAALALTYAAAHHEKTPLSVLEPAKQLLLSLLSAEQLRTTCTVLTIAHAGEALAAYYLCLKNGITSPFTQFLWVLQTFIVGFPSLGILRALKAPEKKQ